jgi:hypothetical protein
MYNLTYNLRGGIHEYGLKHLCSNVFSILNDNIQIIEIGSYCGASSSIIAQSFPQSIVNCVDPWTPYTEDCSIIDLEKQELELKEAELIFDTIALNNPNIRKIKCQA